MAGAAVIAGFPVLASWLGDADRSVLQRRDQGEALWIGKRQQVEKGLDYRAHGSPGVKGTVETGTAIVAIADQRANLARARLCQHDRALQQVRLAFDCGQSGRQRLLGMMLGRGAERGVDLQTALTKIRIAVVVLELACNQIHESRMRARRRASFQVDAQRTSARCHQFRVVDQTGLVEDCEHLVAARQRPLGVARRVVPGRAAHHSHQQRNLVGGQSTDRNTEVVFGGPAKAVNRAAAGLAKKHFVEIGLEDFGLAETRLEAERHDGLVSLARQRSVSIEKQILDQLLGDGAATLNDVAGAQVA